MRTYRRPWSWLSPPKREARDEHIRELFAMGKHYDQLADEFGLTKQRIWQIVNYYKPRSR